MARRSQGRTNQARRGHHRPRRHGQDGTRRRGARSLGLAVPLGAALSGQAGAARFDPWLRGLHQDLDGPVGQIPRSCRRKTRAMRCFSNAEAEFHRPRGDRATDRTISSAHCRTSRCCVVLDNFETNLKPQPEPAVAGGEPRWAARIRPGTAASARLAEELAGSPSRVLITCRRPLAALAGKPAIACRLGPLPPGEAALYLREHEACARWSSAASGAELALGHAAAERQPLSSAADGPPGPACRGRSCGRN